MQARSLSHVVPGMKSDVRLANVTKIDVVDEMGEEERDQSRCLSLFSGEKRKLVESWFRKGEFPDFAGLKKALEDDILVVGPIEAFCTTYNKRRTGSPSSFPRTPAKEVGENVARKDLKLVYSSRGRSSSSTSKTLLETGLDAIIRQSTVPNDVLSPAPFLCLVQSTGYGKTRAVLELAKSRMVVYLVCKSLEGSWQRPQVMDDLLSHLEGLEEGACELKWLKFLQVIKSETNKYKSAIELRNAQITEEGKLGKFYDDLHGAWRNATTPTQNPMESILKHSSNLPQDQIKRRKVSYEQAEKITDQSLTICFDEVTALNSVQFRSLRRAAKHEGVLCIFTDTATSICELMPANDHSSSSKGGSLGSFSSPIFALNTMDLFWDSNAASDDYVNLFTAGRPLWKSLYESTDGGVDIDERLRFLIDAAKTLLTRDVGVSDEMLKLNTFWVKPCMVAVFTCRFSLGPLSNLSRLLAKHSLATITHISEDRELVQSTYPSEPVLAEASASYTATGDNVEVVLEHVLASFNRNNKLMDAPRGDVGEMCAAAFLGFAMDDIRSSTNPGRAYLSRSVVLGDLLARFDCWSETASETVHGVANEWEANFTHFIRPDWSPTKNDMVPMWKRRMAYYVPSGLKGLDLLIALKHKDRDEFGTLRVQVKNHSHKFAAGKRNLILTNLWPDNCAPMIDDEPFSVGILVSFGEVAEICRLYDYNEHRVYDATLHSEQPQRLVMQMAARFPTVTSKHRSDFLNHVVSGLRKIVNDSPKSCKSDDDFSLESIREIVFGKTVTNMAD